ncbi:hypothetical protein D1J63_35645 [Streptomyces sp. KPB2]|nr:hypothetical protein D1J63_35645 [Streptomyces sp. KPB2]
MDQDRGHGEPFRRWDEVAYGRRHLMVSHGCIVLSSPPPSPPPPPPLLRLSFRLSRGRLLSHDPRLRGLLCRGHGQPTAVVALWCR